MSAVRKPNRRRIPELAELVNGGLCAGSGKIRYLDERTAAIAASHLGRDDPEADLLGVYGCAECGDWHVGHDRLGSAS